MPANLAVLYWQLLTDVELEEIEQGAQHDVAIPREIWLEQGCDPYTDKVEDDGVLGRLERIEKHMGLK